MSTFVVLSANYNGSNPGQKDALVYVQGTKDGTRCNVSLWWSAIQTAFAASGTAGVQTLIGYWFSKIVETYPVIFDKQPAFPIDANIPAPIQSNGAVVVCAEALNCGTWTA